MTVRDLIPRSFRAKNVPVRHEESNPFSILQHEMDSLFDRFYRTFDIEPWSEGNEGGFYPKIDVTESEKEIKVSAELPGVDEKDVEILLNRDSLTIKGEKKDERESKGKHYYRLESSFGTFSRTIPIPEEIESEKVEAHYKKGVLTVLLPKTAETVRGTKKIAVKGE